MHSLVIRFLAGMCLCVGYWESELEKAYLASVVRTTTRWRFTAENEIAACNSSLAKLTKQRNKANETAIAELKQKIESMKTLKQNAIDSPAGILDARDLAEGEVGFIGDGDKEFDVLVEQVTGEDTALVRTGGNLYILEASMKSVIDDSFFHVARPVEVKGTRRYETVSGGSKTVRVLRMLSEEEYKRVVDYARANKPKPPKNLRAWTDLQKKELVKAEFKSRIKDKVIVVTEDDKEVEIPYSSLSREDRLWIKDK